jgi:hypothetical protein
MYAVPAECSRSRGCRWGSRDVSSPAHSAVARREGRATRSTAARSSSRSTSSPVAGTTTTYRRDFIDDAIRADCSGTCRTTSGWPRPPARQGRFNDAEHHFAKLAELRGVYEFSFANNHDGERAIFHLERRDLRAALESVDATSTAAWYALRVLGLGTKASSSPTPMWMLAPAPHPPRLC